VYAHEELLPDERLSGLAGDFVELAAETPRIRASATIGMARMQR
jgi:hypothetical protein